MAKINSPVFFWLKTLSKFTSIQIAVQILGFASGILLIRTLSKEEYAYFTLANSMQGAMNVLADSGIGSALSAIGGKVWQDPYRFGQLINTAMQWRRYLAMIAVVFVTPILCWMLLKNGASIGNTIFLVIGILLELNFYLQISVFSTVLRLHTKIGRIQQLMIIGAVSRITLLVVSYRFINAVIGVFSSTIATALQVVLLNHWVGYIVDIKAPIHNGDRKEIKKLVRVQLPNSIFFCLQGQLTVLLISIFGNTQSIAEIGALSRLSFISSLLTSIMSNIILPDFSRCQCSTSLVKKYFKILILYLLSLSVLISVSLLFPSELLWILGGQYSNLNQEVVLVIASNSIHAFAGVLWSINASKGWVSLAWLFPIVIILTQALLLSFLDISEIKGVLIFSMLSIVPASFINFYMTYQGIKEA